MMNRNTLKTLLATLIAKDRFIDETINPHELQAHDTVCGYDIYITVKPHNEPPVLDLNEAISKLSDDEMQEIYDKIEAIYNIRKQDKKRNI